MSIDITVQNLSKTVSQPVAEAITAALSEQALVDFNGSAWVEDGHVSPAGSVTLLGPKEKPPAGTWHLEILDTSDEPGALGYHEEQPFKRHTPEGKPEKAASRSERGLRADEPHLPLMKVFAKTSKQDGVPVSEVASHEMLEALVDPTPMIQPFLAEHGDRVYIVEVGDPVQETPYEVAGQKVANFALPAWFDLESQDASVDFCAVLSKPFSLAPGGYISFYPKAEPEAWEQEFGPSEGPSEEPEEEVESGEEEVEEPVEEPSEEEPEADEADKHLWKHMKHWAKQKGLA